MSEFVWARKRELHSAPDICWSRCDGCDLLTVKPREWAKRVRYGYYCNAKLENLTREEIYAMTEDECPIGRKLPRERGKRW